MEDKGIYEDLTAVQKRANTVFRGIAVLVLVILGYYWKVQILDFQKYWELAEANPTRVSVLVAPRGLILDRNGAILADNKASYKVSLLRENVRNLESSVAAVGEFLGIEKEDLKDRLERYKGVPVYEPIVIKDNLDFDREVPRIMSRKKEFPELVVETEPMRTYPRGNLAAHVLGYLQERTPDEIADKGRRFRPGDMGGRSGIERTYDSLLAGWDGAAFEVVDSVGKSRGVFSRQEAKGGTDISLTLDLGLQTAAEKILEGREGSVVVMDPSNGEILAMASFPTFDPNAFISRFTPDEWLRMVNDPAAPLENRTIRGLYAPGSIFKLVMGLGALDFGFISAATTYTCSGAADYYGSPRHCWLAGGHGSVNLADAVRYSCNIYFYNLGRQMGIDTIARAGKEAGLGRKTGVDIPGEKEGLVPSSKWKLDTQKTPWYPGETISVAIGQGQLLVTPLQVAALTAVIANRGSRVTPHLLLASGEGSPAGPLPVPDVPGTAAFKESSFERIIEGMWRSVNAGGTGAGAFVPGLEICGKTGSTQVISREQAKRLALAGREIKTHSWFAGFAPRDNPRLVVTVLVEYGGGGGALAAPLAGEIFRLFQEAGR